jgi:hypothetical protein
MAATLAGSYEFGIEQQDFGGLVTRLGALYGFPGEEKTVISDMHDGAMSCHTCRAAADQPWHADGDGTGQVRA